MKKILFLLSLLCLPLTLAAQIIPQPNHVVRHEGTFTLPARATMALPSQKDCRRAGVTLSATELKDLAAQYAEAFALTKGKAKTADIRLVPKQMDGKEGAYELDITTNGIEVRANGGAGFFYALQSLLQLSGQRTFACQTIQDAPRFGWRGMHLDVSRHFFSKEYVKRQLRAMARYKINQFHWHLVDGAGWRIQMKRYPELTDSTAFRREKDFALWGKNGMRFCAENTPGAYGGYYTQEDIREVVDYARRLHINVVPEIDVPGHSWEVLAVYPELGCTGKPFQNSELCIGKEATFTFVENVLEEVLALFPSKIIHIGGDEAERHHWEKCPDCQRRMAQEGLKDVKELQSYMTKRLEKFLEARGRHLLGWDEILEGGLSPNATVMSWRGEDGGIAAARMGNNAVMAPGLYCYFDNAQDNPQYEPPGFGSYLPLKQTYGYEPLSPHIREAKAEENILGVHGCLWTELVETEAHADYMIYPRLLALAEVGWTQPENKNFDRFRPLAVRECDQLRAWGYHTFDLRKERGGRPGVEEKVPHLGMGKKVTYHETSYPERYAAGGDTTLTDGWHGGFRYQDRRWQGYEDQDMNVTIDLGEARQIREISTDFYQSLTAWIFLPKGVTYSFSNDGVNFTPQPRLSHDIPQERPELIIHNFRWTGDVTARYVRLHAEQNGRKGGWLFVDEVEIK